MYTYIYLHMYIHRLVLYAKVLWYPGFLSYSTSKRSKKNKILYDFDDAVWIISASNAMDTSVY